MNKISLGDLVLWELKVSNSFLEMKVMGCRDNTVSNMDDAIPKQGN